MNISAKTHQAAQDLLHFIDASPSPWHVVANVEARLKQKGFSPLCETQAWQLKAGGRYYVTRGAASVIAFVMGEKPVLETGFRMVGAHTDSPGLRLKPQAAYASQGLAQLGVEVYGGPILATFADRDLSLAGRVNVRSAHGFETHLVKFDEALVRLPNLAIHMNREVNDKGLLLNKQTGLPLIFGFAQDNASAAQHFKALLSAKLKVDADDIIHWEMQVYDTQKGSFWGEHQAFIAHRQLDNLASCHAALSALEATEAPSATLICALFDHEEVGSESLSGAGGSLLNDVLARIAHGFHLSAEEQLRALAKSFLISADMAHAFHPNHACAYEPHHHVMMNQGPVIKINANQRYSTTASTAARFITLCEAANVPYQQYAHRTDLGCGSTIGPIVSAQLGVPSVDVGCPMWAMHSARESAGVLDHDAMTTVLKRFLSE